VARDELAPSDTGNSNPNRTRTVLVVSLLAAIVALVAVAMTRSRTASGPQGMEDAEIERLTADSGLAISPAVSPDGRLLAFASDRSGRGDLDIWIQQSAGGVPVRLTDDPTDDTEPEFSPDGSQIVFRSDRDGGGIYSIPTLGGTPRLLVRGGR